MNSGWLNCDLDSQKYVRNQNSANLHLMFTLFASPSLPSQEANFLTNSIMSKLRFDIIPYRPELVKRAKELRKNLTPAESRLWKFISRKQVLGVDFDRQKPTDRYIVDFYCKRLKLAIEIDGQSHDFKVEYDLKRQEILESFGIKMIRFSEKEVLKNLESVLSEIEYWVQQMD